MPADPAESNVEPVETRPFPALSTPRLTLRAFAEADTPVFGELLAFYIVTRFSDWPDAPPPDRCDAAVKRMIGSYPEGWGCAWAIEETASATLIGAIRLNYIIKGPRVGGIGYELHPGFWGKGLATEALHAVVACAHGFFELNRLEAWTLPGNDASDRVLAKSGFIHEGTMRQKGYFKGAFHDFRWFGRLKDDPVARP